MKKIETIKLDNGLTVYLYNDERRHSTFFSLVTKFGGIYNDFKVDGKEYHINDGVAHILEHYLVEENEYGNFLDTLGKLNMNTNAATYYDMTRYYFDTVRDVNIGIDAMLKAVYSPIFTEDRLNKLKGPIYQEIRGHMDNKFYHSRRLTNESLFHNLTFKDIAGTLEDVKNADIETIKLCYEAFYNPTNQFIVVAGNFNKDEVIKTINDFYSKIVFPQHTVEKVNVLEDKTVKRKRAELVFRTPQEYREVNYKIDVSDLDNYEYLKLDFYLAMFYKMFFGPASSIYKELVNDRIITHDINVGDVRFDGFLIINIGSFSDKADILEKRIEEVINNLDSFDEEIFELEKNDSMLRVILRDENIMHVIMPFISNIVFFDYPYLDDVDFIKQLNFKEFKEYIKKLDFSNYTVTSIVNEKEN